MEAIHALLQDFFGGPSCEVIGVYLDHELVEVLDGIFELF